MIASPTPFRSLCALALSAFASFALTASTAPDADRAALHAGVTTIAAPGAPGAVCAFDPGAFALIGGKEGKSALLPVVAAARWEKGRAVAFGHDVYLGASSDPDTGRLLANATRWVAGDAPKPKVAVYRQDALLAYLKSNGFDAEAIDGSSWSGKLGGFPIFSVRR